MSPPRTFKLTAPRMDGDDIRNWQNEIAKEFGRMGVDYPIKADGDYGVGTRSATASLCHALGMIASEVMSGGVTPALRTRIRNRKLTVYERARMVKRVGYRRALRRKHTNGGVALPVAKILADSWGYHPGVHDGIDVICPENAPIYAMVRSIVIDVRGGPGDRANPSSPWWGKSPSGDTHKGDGIIQLKVLENTGPFLAGQHIGYGHAEKATVAVGDIVKAGEQIGHAGLAVAWHIHLMLNDGKTEKGIGNLDPRRYLDYCKENA